ncbi:MAG: SIMPL domain-containing protein [Lachnospiraceae bacterium]|nr:SIMPL domain-containing protein [Lachnospiraceae bacterium]
MNNVKSIIVAIIIGLSAMGCVVLGSMGLVKMRKVNNASGFSATGSAKCDFVSDLIVWRGDFNVTAETTSEAYAQIKEDAEKTKKFMMDNGVTEDEMVFSSVNIYRNTYPQFDENGNYIRDLQGDYTLSQQVEISSSDVEKVEKLSRDISAIIESGVQFNSWSPEYYYTRLDELKLQLIEEATANARQRIELMAQESGAQTGELLSANLGVFQITAQNSSSDDYSYGGTFNTGSKNKTASITVKLNYAVK